MNKSQLIEAIQIAERLREIEKTNSIRNYFPDSGPLRRELYPKQLEHFQSGLTKRERLFLCGNRVGKSLAGAYEVTCHLTGLYPKWWTGRRFNKPVRVWAAGDTSKTVRDIVQRILMGEPGQYGTGMIPKDKIVRTLARTGLGDAVDVVHIKHVSGNVSQLTFKSYDQRRESFQGTEQDVIWLDEESPMDIYVECLLRTMTNEGIMILTFTPLQGLSNVVLSFLSEGSIEHPIESNSKGVVTASWDDVPHLSAEAKEQMLLSMPPYQRDARSKGIPQLGSGAIYPIPESEIVVDDFVPPKWWPRAYGLDVGWNFTAAVFVCKNPDTGIMYVYNTYKVGGERASVHAAAIRGVDGRIPGSIDPASRGRGQTDGQQLFQMYRDLGLDIAPADNAVESGIEAIRQLLISGRLKLMKIAAAPLLAEYRTYRRSEDGKVVKENDHVCFVAGTLISAPGGGLVPVEYLKVGDAVCTPLGIARVTHASSMDRQCISNGILSGTPEHPVFHRNKWTRLDAVSYDELCESNLSSSTESHSGATQIHHARVIATTSSRMLSTSKLALKAFIERYGNRFMDLFQTSITSTMSMGIPAITIHPILNVCMDQSTSQDIKREKFTTWNISQAFDRLRRYGMHRTREENGTENMLSKSRTISLEGSDESSIARIAVNRSRATLASLLSSALTTASRLPGVNWAWTMSPDLARYVASHLFAASTSIRKPAAYHAPIAVGSQKVYSITTEHGCYVANGQLVSNCDALRYWAMMFTVGGKAMRPAEEQPMSMQEQAIWEAAITGKQKGHPMTVQQ